MPTSLLARAHLTHRSRGRCVEVKQTADIWPGGVDGRVQAELLFVHTQVGAALLHHLTQDIHLHLVTTQFKIIRFGGARFRMR